ncbi:MAG: glycoside hydrolase family 127 protein, partial [Bacteroidales bacterium]|nr:glycoside hydrolase family 127 protein [Bacteroidales bacterium]
SMLISILDLYQLEGKNPNYLRACEIAVEDMVKNRMYITGGLSQTEHFRDDHNLSCTNADDAQEACAVAHFIYLCRNLFYITGDPKYINYIEKGLYNNGLGSKNPQNTFLTSYFSPLQGYKKWKETTHLNGTPCCSASMARELVRIPEIMWTKFSTGGIGVLLYNQASCSDTIVDSKGGNVPLRLEMNTDFPLSGKVILEVNPEHSSVFPLKLRVPDWTNSYTVLSGDKEFKGEKGEFVTIEKRWKKGDSLIIDIEMSEHVLEGGESYPGHIAFQRGPQILAVDSKLNPAFGNLQNIRTDVKYIPQLENADKGILPEKWWGSQVYQSGFLHNDSVFLVPYAEAGQMSAHDEIRTWIRVNDGWTVVDDDQFTYVGKGWNIEHNTQGHYGNTIHT